MLNSTHLILKQDGRILEGKRYTRKDLIRTDIMVEAIRYGIVFMVILLLMSHFRVYRVSSSSMAPTLHIGEVGFTQVIHSADDIQRGDIVLFNPVTAQNKDLICYGPQDSFIKRIIGLPGERISIMERQVYINGEPLDEPYAVYMDSGTSEMEEIVIPDGCYFMMGDNRDRSADSRGDLGCIPFENIGSKSFFHTPSLVCRLMGLDS